MTTKRIARKTFVSLAVTLLTLFLLEVGIRGYDLARSYYAHPDTHQPAPVPLHVVNDTPVLYGLNPGHPDINSQGLRDDEVAIPKPEGVGRILVLGDSVAYWHFGPEG